MNMAMNLMHVEKSCSQQKLKIHDTCALDSKN